ncbi:MAG: acetyltransferase [Dehalococcoidia bacterium]|jgi:hypothetical protein
MEENNVPYWAILELMGHRRVGGKISETVIGGVTFLRIDIPTVQGGFMTQLYSPQAIYCITPTTEEIATSVAKYNQPEPVYRFEIPQHASPEREED